MTQRTYRSQSVINQWVLGAVLGLVVVGCDTKVGGAQFKEVTVCELSSNAKLYNGQKVQVRATVESDGIEHTILADPACPNLGVAYKSTDSAAHSKLGQKLFQELFETGAPGSVGKHISVTVVGHFFDGSDTVGGPRTLLVEQVLEVSSSGQ